MKMLVGLDFSPRMGIVLDAARNYARQMNARLYLVHVVTPDRGSYDPKSVRQADASNLQDAHVEIQQKAELCRREGLDASARLAQGPVPETLLTEAGRLECDLLLLGSHGAGALRHLLGGSVSLAVLEKTDRPVLIVPTR